MSDATFKELLGRLRTAAGQGPAARSVEIFGWVILVEGAVMVLAPGVVEAVLRLPALTEQAQGYFRLVGVLVSGLGTLYVVSGRLSATAFVFASLLDRPLVPPVMAILWYLEILPGTLAAAFAIQDLAGFLWTVHAWRAERRSH